MRNKNAGKDKTEGTEERKRETKNREMTRLRQLHKSSNMRAAQVKLNHDPQSMCPPRVT
jgi:hypothetical protein